MAAVTLYRAKPALQRRLRPLVGRAAQAGVRPNHLTVAAVGVAGLAGALAATGRPPLLLAVPALYLVRLTLNAMDGLLAREHGMVSRAGAVLNEVGDVAADALAYLPFAAALPGHAPLVVTVVCLGLATEVAALAGGRPRRNDGPLGKPDRAAAFAALAVCAAFGWQPGPLLWLLAVLGAATIVNRSRPR